MPETEIRALHSDDDHAAAMREIERLWDDPAESAQERLEVLSILVEAYEREHHALPSPDPIEALEFHLEQRGLTRNDLIPLLGTRTRVYEVMTRRRPLTLNMIRALHHQLGIPADSLVGAPR